MTSLPAEAITAAVSALEAFWNHDGDSVSTGAEDLDGTLARAALEAAAPAIRAQALACWTRIEPDPGAPGYNRGVFDVSGYVGEVLAPAERERIRAQAAAAERERCAQLAEREHVMYTAFHGEGCPGVRKSFADLLREDAP